MPKKQKSRFIRPKAWGNNYMIIQADVGKVSLKCLLPFTKKNRKLDTGNERDFFNLTE